MKMTLTAKLKLQTTPEQFAALRQTQLTYRDALNAVSCYAYEQGKTSNVTKLHKGMYAALRTRHHLPSQLACSVERAARLQRYAALRWSPDATSLRLEAGGAN